MQSTECRKIVGRRLVSLSALVIASAALGACSSGDESEASAQAQQSISLADSCGYEVSGSYHKAWHHHKHGNRGIIELTNVEGDAAKSFELFVDLTGATMEHVHHATAEQVEGGYRLISPHWLRHAKIREGRSHFIEFKGSSSQSEIKPYVISVNGVACDSTPPTVTLDTSGSFYTAGGTLLLTATAADNVAVKKVVFMRDGEIIGTDSSAPYVLEVPISAATNGRDRYTAVAYDMSNNAQTSNTKSVLTSIDNKFFGCEVDVAADYTKFLTYFNQVTPGNAGKWGSVEAVRDQMDLAKLDTAYQFAQSNGFPFKLHTLVWGQQQPNWLSGLSAEQQLAEIDQWMALLAKQYPNVELVDVVNEPMHAVPAYSAALGGAGVTGWDWVIKAFEMARSHFPNAELILNEYNVLILQSYTNDYLKIIKLLQERGLIDGIGLQGHFLERADLAAVAANLDTLAATGLPIYISELDINFADDARQAKRMSELFPILWRHPSVVGVTHWGYLQGAMWQPDAYLVRTDGTERPAMTWLNCFRAGRTDCTVPEYIPVPRKGQSAGITLEAEDYDNAQGLMAAGNMVAYTDNGDWESFDRVVFDANWDSLSVTYARGNSDPASISIHLDSLDNAPLATVQLPNSGGWGVSKTLTIPWAPIAGEHNVLIRFNGSYGVGNLDNIKFSAPSGTSANVITDSDFEAGTDGWWSWGGGTIATTTTRALSGKQGLAMTARTGNSPLVKSLTSAVIPGKTYKVALWSTIGGADTANVHVTTAIQCNGQSAQYAWLGGEKSIANGAWVEFTGDLVIPDCQLQNVMLYLEGPGAGIDLYLDHVSVRAQAAANLLSNGTFESGTTGWFTWNGGTLAATTTRAHGGSKSLLVGTRTSNAPAATDLTSVVKAGGSYPVSVWVSIDSPTGASGQINLTRMISCEGASDSYAWVGSAVTVSDDGQWVELKSTLDIPTCTLKKVMLYVEGTAGMDLYVDDASVSDPALTNVMPDGTFESALGAWFSWGTGTLAVTNARAHSGLQSLGQIGRTSNSPIARSLMGLVNPGKSYQISLWSSVDTPDGASANVNLTSKVDCAGQDPAYSWIVNPVAVADGGWSKLVGTLNVPPDCTLEDVAIWAEGPGAGIDFYIDDVTMSPR